MFLFIGKHYTITVRNTDLYLQRSTRAKIHLKCSAKMGALPNHNLQRGMYIKARDALQFTFSKKFLE